MNRNEIRKALDEMGLRYASNTVRPPKTRVTRLGSVAIRVSHPENPLCGAIIRNTLTAGYASDGFHSDYERRRRWWIVTSIEDDDGHVVWARGTRFSSQNKVEGEWAETVVTMKQDGELIHDAGPDRPLLTV